MPIVLSAMLAKFGIGSRANHASISSATLVLLLVANMVTGESIGLTNEESWALRPSVRRSTVRLRSFVAQREHPCRRRTQRGYPAARRDPCIAESPAVTFAPSVNSPYLLSSQTKTMGNVSRSKRYSSLQTGRPDSANRRRRNSPPRAQDPRSLIASAAPTACGTLPATIPVDPMLLTSGHRTNGALAGAAAAQAFTLMQQLTEDLVHR